MLVLVISLFNDFGVTQLWIDFGSGKHRISLPIYEMCIDEINAQVYDFFLLYYWLWPGFIPCLMCQRKLPGKDGTYFQM